MKLLIYSPGGSGGGLMYSCGTILVSNGLPELNSVKQKETDLNHATTNV